MRVVPLRSLFGDNHCIIVDRLLHGVLVTFRFASGWTFEARAEKTGRLSLLHLFYSDRRVAHHKHTVIPSGKGQGMVGPFGA